jgi:hypothetical protein
MDRVLRDHRSLMMSPVTLTRLLNKHADERTHYDIELVATNIGRLPLFKQWSQLALGDLARSLQLRVYPARATGMGWWCLHCIYSRR